MSKYKNLYIIVSCSIFIVIVLLLSFDNNIFNANTKTYDYNKKLTKKVINYATEDYTKFYEYNLTENIKNVAYKSNDGNSIKSYLIDKDSGKIVDFKTVLKSESIEEFYEKEKELLYYKYPKFIVDGIFNSSFARNFIFYENKLIIYYNNVVTSPMYNDIIYLTINYNEIYNFLNFDYELDKEYQNESGYDYDSTKIYLAFSFDDGPNINNTKDIVNALEDNKMKATFFMVGNLMNNNPDLVQYVYNHNMEIGSHSYKHSNINKQKDANIDEEIALSNSIYNSITGDNFKLFRPPYGSINNKFKEKYDYSYVLWSVDTNDWRYKDSDYVYNYLLNNINSGDIVLMHDLFTTTKDAVLRVLPELYVRGYRVVSVSDLANIKGVTLLPHETYRSIK